MIQIEEYTINKMRLYDSQDIYGSWLQINHSQKQTATFTATFGEHLLDFLKYNKQITQRITIESGGIGGTIEQPVGSMKTDGFYHDINIDLQDIFNIVENINIDYERENYISDYNGHIYLGDTYSLQYNISVEKITNNPNAGQDKEFEKINNFIKNVLFLDIDIEDVKERRQIQYSRGNYIETRYYFLVFDIDNPSAVL